MEKEIKIPIDIDVNRITDEIAVKVKESKEDFVFETISKWYKHSFREKITKRELLAALLRQKSIKPITEQPYKDDPHCVKTHRCARCLSILPFYEQDYCHKCGQKVDWE